MEWELVKLRFTTSRDMKKEQNRRKFSRKINEEKLKKKKKTVKVED